MPVVLADALFRITLDWRMHRRGETHVDYVTEPLANVHECKALQEIKAREGVTFHYDWGEHAGTPTVVCESTEVNCSGHVGIRE